MATIFRDSGVIIVDVLQGQRTVTGCYYTGVLRGLKAALAANRRGKLHRGVLLHHDNAPAHPSRATSDALREYRLKLLPHPPYSPDLAPSDLFLFPKLKEHLRGARLKALMKPKLPLKPGSK